MQIFVHENRESIITPARVIYFYLAQYESCSEFDCSHNDLRNAEQRLNTFIPRPNTVEDDLRCVGRPCEVYKDYNTCCVEKARCETFTCPTFYPKYPIVLQTPFGGYHGVHCKGVECNNVDDVESCCIRNNLITPNYAKKMFILSFFALRKNK